MSDRPVAQLAERQTLDLEVVGSLPTWPAKHCSGCLSSKPLSGFNKNRRTRDGLQKWCRQCQNTRDRLLYSTSRVRQLKVYARVRVKIGELKSVVARIRQLNPCSSCGEPCAACLEFHHLDPASKDVCVSSAVRRGWSVERLLVEIRKCVVLCANCHRKLHAGLVTLPSTTIVLPTGQ